MKEFPTYENHLYVKCFRCDRHITTPHIESKYPDGVNAKLCQHCGMYTWYNIKKGGTK